jgi:hypothetical protein
MPSICGRLYAGLTLRGNIGTVESLLEVLLDAVDVRAHCRSWRTMVWVRVRPQPMRGYEAFLRSIFGSRPRRAAVAPARAPGSNLFCKSAVAGIAIGSIDRDLKGRCRAFRKRRADFAAGSLCPLNRSRCLTAQTCRHVGPECATSLPAPIGLEFAILLVL